MIHVYDTDCYTRSQALGYVRLALKEMAAKKSDELGENELNMISGGWFFNNESTYVGYNAY